MREIELDGFELIARELNLCETLRREGVSTLVSFRVVAEAAHQNIVRDAFLSLCALGYTVQRLQILLQRIDGVGEARRQLVLLSELDKVVAELFQRRLSESRVLNDSGYRVAQFVR